jgi:hypothetical protein
VAQDMETARQRTVSRRRRFGGPRRVLAAGAASALLASGVVGTAPPSGASSPTLVSVQHATNSTLGLTSQFQMVFRRAPQGNSQLPLSAEGAVDFAAPSATLRLDLPRSSGGTESMVFLPGTVFFKPPPSSPPLRVGRPWVFANFSDIAKYKVNFPPYIVQTENINPSFTLYQIAWGATAVSGVHRVMFEGAPATTCLVTIDLQHALQHVSGANGSVFALTLASEIAASGQSSPKVTARVWIDKIGRLVGARILPVGAGIGTLTLSLSHFGTPVHADKPPRAKVVDLAATIPGGEREALNGGDADGA